MSWINEHQRGWRTGLLLLAAVALAGPWLVDTIHVPAEFACSPPNVRLEGDFCGTPLPGIMIFMTLIGGFAELSRAVALNELPRALQVFPVLAAVALSLLPLFTTLILIISHGRRFRLQVAVWGAAAISSPFLALTILSRPHLALWGIWLYVGLAVGALVLEMSAFVADKQSGPTPVPER